MDWDRRDLIKQAIGAGGFVLLGGVGIGALRRQRCHAKDVLWQQFMAEPTRLLAEKANDELNSLPILARQEMRDYFHGICLNVHSFVEEICANSFAEKLHACESEEQKHLLLNVAFSQKVVTATEVSNRVEVIANEVGTLLDSNWGRLCGKLADNWQEHLRTQRSDAKTLNVRSLADPYIIQSLNESRQRTYPIGQRPAISTTGREIGKAAILLLPVGYIMPQVGYPIFVLAALKSVWSWLLGRPKESLYQTDVSERLAILGNRVGSECEEELRKRIADLQHWQEEAIKQLAHNKVNESIPGLI